VFNKSSNNTNKPEISRVDTIIGENAVVEGVLRTKDTTRIDGKIKGEGFFEGHLIIGESGKVEGDITANSMLVAGAVEGNIHVRNKLEIAETGKIKGDIATKLLYIAEGAVFEGKSTMNDSKSSTPEKSVTNDFAKKEAYYIGDQNGKKETEKGAK